jgi:hypothetical protein
MNYIQLVNSVLRRLREPEVSSVSDNSYAKLIGDFVNDAKRQVEDSYSWNALSDTLTATTTNDIFNYVLVGSGQRFRMIDVINDTDDFNLKYQTVQEMNRLFLMSSSESGSPRYYNFNGTDANGDTQVDLYPIPDGVYNIRFNVIKPQPKLAANTDVLLVPEEPVIFNATARAMAERGEDGGITSNEMYALYNQSLADAIAIETSRYEEEGQWFSV